MKTISGELQAMREHYDQDVFRRKDLNSCPYVQFSTWLSDAVEKKIYDPNAFSLATVDSDGRPFARAVLLKGMEEGGFTFYTNYKSRKASHLEKNPNACIHFPWFALQRQVVVTGLVSKLGEQVAEDYFRSRPTLSKLGAWASQQSQEVDSRESLEKAFLKAKEKWGEDPPKPPHWGGFSLFPDSIEFWQGGPNRLHDRFIYSRRKDGENWEIKRLNP